jgi:hypothetical protein
MCKNKVTTYIRNVGDLNTVEITVNCGDIVAAGVNVSAALCPVCERQAMCAYPQGWQHYPGDKCKHGTYIGGDRDCACHYCEEEE